MTRQGIDPTTIHSKLVLLTLSFPRLRIIWSSSPQASVDIIADLKQNHPEPDQAQAITIGGEEGEFGASAADGEGSGLFNSAPEEMLRALPGINSRNYKLVSSRVATIKELCEVKSRDKMADVLGSQEGGKVLFDFINKDGR